MRTMGNGRMYAIRAMAGAPTVGGEGAVAVTGAGAWGPGLATAAQAVAA